MRYAKICLWILAYQYFPPCYYQDLIHRIRSSMPTQTYEAMMNFIVIGEMADKLSDNFKNHYSEGF